MASQAVQDHNNARAEAQGGPRPSLTWSDDLAAGAQAWANHMAETGQFEHDPNAGAGENLFGGSGRDFSYSDGVADWVGEKKNYNGENIGDGDFSAYGHYTQVIWPETTQVGMGSAKGSNGWTYVVGRYSPQGNITGLSAYRPGTTGPTAPVGGGQGGSGFYLVNSYKEGGASSGMAWYNHLGGNDGNRPDMYVDIKTGGVVTWEGGQFEATFPNETTVSVTLEDNATVQAAPLWSQVGTAHVGGKEQAIYKDKIRVLYEVDQWKVYCVYYGST